MLMQERVLQSAKPSNLIRVVPSLLISVVCLSSALEPTLAEESCQLQRRYECAAAYDVASPARRFRMGRCLLPDAMLLCGLRGATDQRNRDQGVEHGDHRFGFLLGLLVW